jgi:ABC-type polysaccharide/polyol phosphate export permease
MMTGGTVHASWLAFIPVMVIVQLAMTYPLGLMLAAGNVLVRDVEYIIGILLQMLFFLTPIVYPPDAVPERYARYLWWNPFSPMIDGWRAVLYDGRLDGGAIGRCLVFALVATVLAAVVHQRLRGRVGELL